MPITSKKRLDITMVEQGLVESRGRAKALILTGTVYVGGRKIDKPGTLVSPGEDISIRDDSIPFVSRGGIKLQKALEYFKPPIHDKIFMDVGASTGGFTDCLLQNGVKKVYAIDVGYGQLAWKLRQDHRVVVMEKTNIRDVTQNNFDETPHGAVIDVAFISLRIVLPIVQNLLSDDSYIIALIKPQFEAGREKVGKKGVVRSQEIHQEVLENISKICLGLGLAIKGLTYSPVKGPKGNIEFLIYLYKGHGDYRETGIYGTGLQKSISKVVKVSHEELHV